MIAEHLSNILKLFLPSWNFFNDFSVLARLDLRVIGDGHEVDWLTASKASPSDLARVLFNPRGNLALLQHSYIERAAGWFEQNPEQSPQQFAKTHHHRLLAIIARNRIGETDISIRFQFRLVITNPGTPDTVLFTSQELGMGDSR